MKTLTISVTSTIDKWVRRYAKQQGWHSMAMVYREAIRRMQAQEREAKAVRRSGEVN